MRTKLQTIGHVGKNTRSGQDGVSSILRERMQNNKPRVTNQKKIITHVCDFLKLFLFL
jgi:hypothetical protein